MKKVLVTGASGMLGSRIAEYIQQSATFEVYGVGRKNIIRKYKYCQLDLLDKDAVKEVLNELNPDTIIHCAANVNLNDCEVNKENANSLHIEATKTLASFKSGECKIIYISTDSVFDGVKGDYTETDQPSPLNYYALSKLMGEEKLAQVNPNFLVLRTNLYGFHKFEEGNSLFEWIYQNLSKQKNITGFTNIYFNPLYTGQISQIVFQFLDKKETGLFHLGCKEKITKYKFALMVAEEFGFEKSLIQSGSYEETTISLKRPKNTTLDYSKFMSHFHKEYSITEGIKNLKAEFFDKKN
jgi:dTDP-4-dehydrorhamnose reductase